MKIDTHQLEAILLNKSSQKTDKTGNNPFQTENFADLLNTQTSPPALTLTGSPEESTQALLNGALIGQLTASQASQSPLLADADNEVEGVLNILEEYAKALDDPQKTLKDIAPLAENLTLGANRLSQLSLGLPSGDPLKAISSDTAILATVEAMKFKRGDFV